MPSQDSGEGRNDRVRRLRRQHEDLRHTLNHHLDDFEEQAERANRIARFDGIVLTIFVGLFSTTTRHIPLWLFSVIVLGFALVTAAIVIALWEQRGREVEGGPGEGTIQQANEYEMSEEDYLEWILEDAYTKSIIDAREKVGGRVEDVELIARLSIVGIVVLLGATLFVPVI